MNGVQYAKKAQTSTPRLLSSRLHAMLGINVPMAGQAAPHGMDCQPLVSTPWVALADSTRLACRYKVAMKFSVSPEPLPG